MGGSSSRAVKRISALLSNGGATDEDDEDGQRRQKSITSLATPFVLTRWGSMYVDEDGDVAHEFYVESTENSRKTVMQKITTNIKPQGEVLYDFPRLHVDLPIIICER